MKPTLKDLVPDVDTKHGAPMGRENVGRKTKSTNTRKVHLREGYDRGGAYWGYPNNLYVEFSNDLLYIRFFRV